MKKIVLSGMLLMGALSAQAADFHPTCEQYFKQIDEIVAQTPESSKEMMAEVKKQVEASKAQMKQMPMDAQEQGCKQGIEALKQMQQ